MNSKVILSSIALSSLLFANDGILVKRGWQNLGTSKSISLKAFKIECVEIAWVYDRDEQKWKAFSPDENMQQLINRTENVGKLKLITKNQGFWIKAKKRCYIKEDDNDTILFHGKVYKTVKSPYTDRIWLDRNIGADEVCQSRDDKECYGGYFQWGRDIDGHELSNSKTTNEQANSLDNLDNKFIFADWGSPNYGDWAKSIDSDKSKRVEKWSKLDGSSVCPVGFRVPTLQEFKDELEGFNPRNPDDMFNSFLKLPSPGFRALNEQFASDNGNKYFFGIGSEGIYWTTDVNVMDGGIKTLTYHFYDNADNGLVLTDGSMGEAPAFGCSVRCIKDGLSRNKLPVANAGVDQTVTKGSSVTFDGGSSKDDDGEIVKYEWSLNGEIISTQKSFTKDDFEIGEYTIKLTVTDDRGGKSSDEMKLTVIEDTTITFKGLEYKPVTSPYTGRVWLDRNLGAKRVCQSKTDSECYGDYYQWGRRADGHEDKHSESISTQASSLEDTNSFFITAGYSKSGDWARDIDSDGTKRYEFWMKTDGSGICPVGFRVPKRYEIEDEIKDHIKNGNDAFNSFLKLPLSGYRRNHDANLNDLEGGGYLWTSSIKDDYSVSFYYDGYSNTAEINDKYMNGIGYRSTGMPVRCIKAE